MMTRFHLKYLLQSRSNGYLEHYVEKDSEALYGSVRKEVMINNVCHGPEMRGVIAHAPPTDLSLLITRGSDCSRTLRVATVPAPGRTNPADVSKVNQATHFFIAAVSNHFHIFQVHKIVTILCA